MSGELGIEKIERKRTVDDRKKIDVGRQSCSFWGGDERRKGTREARMISFTFLIGNNDKIRTPRDRDVRMTARDSTPSRTADSSHAFPCSRWSLQ